MKRSLLLFCFSFTVIALKATHNRAGELLYKRITPYTATGSGVTVPVYTYSFTLIMYTDDGPGIADRCSDTIYFGDGQKALALRINGSGSCGCPSGAGCGEIIVNEAGYRVKKNIYTVTHTYSGAGTYIARCVDPNRNAGMINISNSVNQPFSVSSEVIIIAGAGPNASPVPDNPPVDRGFVNGCFYHDLAAYDIDGDSLAYELVPCEPSAAYTSPDAGTGGTLSVSSEGLLTWCSPQAVGEYAIAIKITEWRRQSCTGPYLRIGSVIRDMQVVVYGGTLTATTPELLADTCMAAGNTLTLAINNGPLAGAANISIYGSCRHGLSPASATLSPTSTFFAWTTDCSQAKKEAHRVVLAYDVSGASGHSARAYKIMHVKLAPMPVQVYSGLSSTNSATIMWHSPGSCSGNSYSYRVYRQAGTPTWTPGYCETGLPASSGYSLVFIGSPTDSAFTDAYLQPFANGSTMNYIVTAVSSNCQEGFAGSPRAVSIVTGIKEEDPRIAVSVYPNPSDGRFGITAGVHLTGALRITVYSIDGRTVYQDNPKPESGTIMINAEHLSPGIYMLHLQTTSGTAFVKLVKE